MGILSKMREKKTISKPKQAELEESVIEKGRKKVLDKKLKDVDMAKSLAMYIVATEILMAELIDENSTFIKVYDKFRKDWELEDMINAISSYDGIFKAIYKEVRKWIDKI